MDTLTDMNQMRTLARKAHSLSWLSYWMDLQGSTSISASGIYTSCRHTAQTGLQVQPASCLIATGGSFAGVKAAGAFTWQLSPIQIKNCAAKLYFPRQICMVWCQFATLKNYLGRSFCFPQNAHTCVGGHPKTNLIFHGYTFHPCYQTLYSPTNAHVQFIKTN